MGGDEIHQCVDPSVQVGVREILLHGTVSVEVLGAKCRYPHDTLHEGAVVGHVGGRKGQRILALRWIGTERHVRIPLDPIPQEGGAIVVQVVVPGAVDVGIEVAEEVVHRQ